MPICHYAGSVTPVIYKQTIGNRLTSSKIVPPDWPSVTFSFSNYFLKQ